MVLVKTSFHSAYPNLCRFLSGASLWEDHGDLRHGITAGDSMRGANLACGCGSADDSQGQNRFSLPHEVLQQHQRLEREATLAELDESRRILLKKLKEYRGKELEVILEACAFAGEPVERRDDLLLPPYPRRLPVSFTSSVDDYSPLLPSAHSASRRRNATVRHSSTKDEREESKEWGCDEKNGDFNSPANNGNDKRLANGLGKVIGLTTKAVLVLASVISVFTLARIEPKLRKRNAPHKQSDFLPKKIESTPTQQTTNFPNRCPPGKVLLVEDGVPRCFVKERVEVPFESVVKDPDISYGFG